MVEPVDPLEGGELDGPEAAPRTEATDDLGLEEADHGLGEGIVVRVADAADGRRDAGLGQALGVLDRQVLHPAIAVVDEGAAAADGPPVVVLTDLPRTVPRRPMWRISRATVRRAMPIPSRPSCRHTLRTPWTRKLSSPTRRISPRSMVSRRTRGGAFAGSARRVAWAWYVDGAIGSSRQIGSTPYMPR